VKTPPAEIGFKAAFGVVLINGVFLLPFLKPLITPLGWTVYKFVGDMD